MEALLSQFSSLADQAVKDKNFDLSRIEALMPLFEAEAERWSSAMEAEMEKAAGEAEAALREAERSLNALMDAGTDDYRRTDEAIRRGLKGVPSRVVLVGKAMKKKTLAPVMTTAKPARDRFVDRVQGPTIDGS